MKWYKIGLFVVAISVISVQAYQKMCFMHPQYGREGSLDDLGTIMGDKYIFTPVNYTIESPDGRRTCRVQLDQVDTGRVKLFLDAHEEQEQIADDMIERLMGSKKGGQKTVGLVLRDFKCCDKNVTVQQVRSGLGMEKDKEVLDALQRQP